MYIEIYIQYISVHYNQIVIEYEKNIGMALQSDPRFPMVIACIGEAGGCSCQTG